MAAEHVSQSPPDTILGAYPRTSRIRGLSSARTELLERLGKLLAPRRRIGLARRIGVPAEIGVPELRLGAKRLSPFPPFKRIRRWNLDYHVGIPETVSPRPRKARNEYCPEPYAWLVSPGTVRAV